MLCRPPTNLNRQSEQATVLLIREVISRGIQLSEVCSLTMNVYQCITYPAGICRCPRYNNHLRGISLKTFSQYRLHGDQ